MAPVKSRSQRKAAFEQAASAMYDRLEAWYDAHPDATFEEIEQEVWQERRELMGEALATLIVGRDSGQGAVAPPCQKCGQPLVFEGYQPWTVKGLEGDTVLERAYYVCPACAGEAFSPSGSEAAAAGGSLEWGGGPRGHPAGLWDADMMALHQYVEWLRRGLDYCSKRSSVNDGALWIKRMTATNFPGVPQIVDWSHASGHLWVVANALHGEQTPVAKLWAEQHLNLLWDGDVAQVVGALDRLDLQQERWPDLSREAPDYFRSNQEGMRYDLFRAQAYPIGSSTVESGANTVVHHRMRRPGRGWTRHNSQAMLAALSELHSGRFEYTWLRLSKN